MTSGYEQAYEELAVRLAGRRSGDEVRARWRRLSSAVVKQSRFDPSQLEGLPEPAQRWLAHALSPGASLAGAVMLRMRGHLRVTRWLPFEAVQLHAPPHGYLWVAKAGWGPVSLRGYDCYADGAGRMRWRLFGRLSLVDASGPDIDRSAAGRVALDAFTVPSSWLGPEVTWQPGPDADSAIAIWKVGSWVLAVHLEVAPDGALRTVSMRRWAAPRGEPWGEYSCGGTVGGERGFEGVNIATTLRAGYFFRTHRWTEGEFFRATVTDATFL
jgi:hypothetical protein